jgi:GWxTD domain-containing protein
MITAFYRSLPILFLILAVMAACSGTRIKLDPESEDFYEYARLIMTDTEHDIFNHLADKAERQRFIRDFWDKRDPDPDTEVNEYKEEFYRRIDYANDRFKEGPPGWKTDRGRIYIYFGSPDKTEEFHPMQTEAEARAGIAVTSRVRNLLRWTYYRYGLAVDFYDRRGDYTYVIDDPMHQIYGNYFDALEFAKMGLDFANKERTQEFKFIDLDLSYGKDEQKFLVTVPLEGFSFKAEDGELRADFEFIFTIYRKSGGIFDEFRAAREFSVSEEEIVKLDELRFTFDYDLAAGSYYVDVTVDVEPDVGKTRKIFPVTR